MDWKYFIAPAIGIAFVIGGIIKLKKVGDEKRLFRMMSALPVTKISDVRQGQVKLEGKVQASQQIKSKYGLANCVYFRSVTEQYRRTGKRGSTWIVVSSDSGSVPFWVGDGSGKIEIDLQGVGKDSIVLNETYIEGGKPKAAGIGPFKYEGFGLGDKRKRESVLKAGDELLVYGRMEKGKITYDKDAPILISTLPEAEVIAKFGSDDWQAHLGGIYAIVIGTMLIVVGCVFASGSLGI
ncbi:MAG: GIDE domain-containing protein [Candidatus Micrarchaeota archaeon]